MSNANNRLVPVLLLVIVIGLVGSAIAHSVSASVELPEGPVDVIWDKSPCSACNMHVGEPPFAAQLTTTDGDTHVFDDPGCLFLYMHDNELEIHSIYFRHLHADRWVGRDAVAFERKEQTPMGYGIGAVDIGTPGAISFEAAKKQCVDRVVRYRPK